MMFSTTDGRIFFLDPFVAGQIEAAGINVRESFTITLKWDGVKGSQRTWEIARVAGEQPNGTFAVPRLPEAKPAQRANSAAGRPEALLDEANALIDTFAAAWDRARTKYEGRLKPEEVKALVITAYIQHNKLSSVA
jgi:hypothetical protein